MIDATTFLNLPLTLFLRRSCEGRNPAGSIVFTSLDSAFAGMTRLKPLRILRLRGKRIKQPRLYHYAQTAISRLLPIVCHESAHAPYRQSPHPNAMRLLSLNVIGTCTARDFAPSLRGVTTLLMSAQDAAFSMQNQTRNCQVGLFLLQRFLPDEIARGSATNQDSPGQTCINGLTVSCPCLYLAVQVTPASRRNVSKRAETAGLTPAAAKAFHKSVMRSAETAISKNHSSRVTSTRHHHFAERWLPTITALNLFHFCAGSFGFCKLPAFARAFRALYRDQTVKHWRRHDVG